MLNIEVQVVNERDIDKRTLYYWAKLYQGQLQSGQTYKELCRTVTINVLAFSFLPDIQNHHSTFELYDIKTGYRLNRDIEVHFLELPKWKALYVKPQTRLEKWLAYLGGSADKQEMEEIVMSEPAIQKALRDQLSALYYAKQEGVVEGKKEIAFRMLGKGSSIEDIVEITGLSLEEVMQLKN